MLGERRTLVNSMVKYTEDRAQRMQAHKDKLLASRGDLTVSDEATDSYQRTCRSSPLTSRIQHPHRL